MSDSDFGKFLDLNLIGRGGMAEVFKARLAGIGGFDKVVVIKRILPSLVEHPEFMKMFLEEARVAANLNHNNVVQIFEIDEVDGIPYIAMEYVDGLTLGQIRRQAKKLGLLNYGHLAKIFCDVSEGLQYVHSATDQSGRLLGLVHRDISPQNIIVSRLGIPKILDFGVAKAEGRLVATQAGTLKGKLLYMSPEQVRGDPDLDGRLDVFALGICLYEATTGQHPYGKQDTNEVSVLRKILAGEFPAPSTHIPDYPPELERIVMSAMNFDRDKRCSVNDIHQWLEAFSAPTGPFPSSKKAVAAWIAQLSQGMETPHAAPAHPPPLVSKKSTSVVARGAKSRSGSRRAMSESESRASQLTDAEIEEIAEIDLVDEALPIPLMQRPPVIAGGATLLIALVALIFMFSGKKEEEQLPEDPPAPAIAAKIPVKPKEQQDPDKAGEAYLNEAERYAGLNKYGPAQQMIIKALALELSDAKLNIRLTELQDRIQRDAILHKATKSFKEGDNASAINGAKQVLDLDPENGRALELLSEARGGGRDPSGKRLAAAAKKSPSPLAREGKLTITSNIPGAMVYIDDEPVGKAPIQGRVIIVGKHTVQVRRSGFLPAESEAQVQAGKEVTLAMNLQKDTASPALIPMEDGDAELVAGSSKATDAIGAPPSTGKPVVVATTKPVPGTLPNAGTRSTEVLDYTEGMTRPERLSGEDPVYTPQAQAAKVEGTMIVKCVVTAAGDVRDCRVAKALPHMSEAVLETLKTWKYKPATVQGQPVSVQWVIPIKLVLPKT